MQLKLEHFNIKIGQHKVLLNIADAKELGVNPGDRVRIRGHQSLSAIVDTTDDMVPPGTLGSFLKSTNTLRTGINQSMLSRHFAQKLQALLRK